MTIGNPASASRYVVFSLSGRRLALPGGAVRRVLPLPRLERLPGQPPVLAGVFVLAGVSVPVLRLATLFGLEDRAPGVYTPLLLTGPEERPLALLVDRVLDVAPAGGPLLDEAEPDASFNRCVAGSWRAGGTLVQVLDPARLLTEAEEERLAGFRALAEERLAVWREVPA